MSHKEILVELEKEAGKGLGLVLTNSQCIATQAVVVDEVFSWSPAVALIGVGDRLLEVNGWQATSAEEAAVRIKQETRLRLRLRLRLADEGKQCTFTSCRLLVFAGTITTLGLALCAAWAIASVSASRPSSVANGESAPLRDTVSGHRGWPEYGREHTSSSLRNGNRMASNTSFGQTHHNVNSSTWQTTGMPIHVAPPYRPTEPYWFWWARHNPHEVAAHGHLRLGKYTSLQTHGTCGHPAYEIMTIPNVSSPLECLTYCDHLRERQRHLRLPATHQQDAELELSLQKLRWRNWCMAAVHNRYDRLCSLKRRCRDLASVAEGACHLWRARWCWYMRGSLRPPRLQLGNYSRLKAPGECDSLAYDLEGGGTGLTLDECLQQCNNVFEQHVHSWRARALACEMVQYNEENRTCRLKRRCEERLRLKVGICRPQAKWCFFTRGPTSKFSASLANARLLGHRRDVALQEAQREMAAFSHTNAPGSASKISEKLCAARPLLNGTGELIGWTLNRNWRYYTILDCSRPLTLVTSSSTSRGVCLTFKTVGRSGKHCDSYP